MDKLLKDIHLYLTVKQHVQTGGKKGRQHLVYNGHKIYYTEYQNAFDDKDTIFFNGGRDVGRRPCFILSIKKNLATLISLERGSDCFVDNYDNSKDLVQVAFHIAKHKGCTDFELTDNSFIQCSSTKFYLSDVYFLTKGKTWYESLLSIKIKSMPQSDLETYRKQVKETSWEEISKFLLEKGTNLDFVDCKGINIKKPGSAMKVLSRIKDLKNEVSCLFFAENTGRIIVASRIESLRGTQWIYNAV